MDDRGLIQQFEDAIAELDLRISEAAKQLAALKRQRKSYQKGLKAISDQQAGRTMRGDAA